MRSLIALVMLAGCAADSNSRPIPVDYAHQCTADPSSACADAGLKGWTMYECDDTWPDPPDMECAGHDELEARGVDWVSVRCCRPTM